MEKLYLSIDYIPHGKAQKLVDWSNSSLHVSSLSMKQCLISSNIISHGRVNLPNAERRTPNAEFRSAVYRVKHVLSVNMAAIEIIDISDN